MNTVSKYLSLVKFAHTIFAMPFAAVGFVYAYATLPAGAHDARSEEHTSELQSR